MVADLLERFARFLVELESLVPPTADVGHHTEVVEHERPTANVAELLVDGDRDVGVHRLVVAAERRVGPIQNDERLCERVPSLLAGHAVYRLPAPLDCLERTALLVADEAAPRRQPRSLGCRLRAVEPLEQPQSPAQPAHCPPVLAQPVRDEGLLQDQACLLDGTRVDLAERLPVSRFSRGEVAEPHPDIPERLQQLRHVARLDRPHMRRAAASARSKKAAASMFA